MKHRFRCQDVTVSWRPVHTSTKSSSHFILINVRVSIQTTVPRQLILMSVCCLPFGQDLAFGQVFPPLTKYFLIHYSYFLFILLLLQDKNTSLKLPVDVSPLQLVNLHRNRRYFVIKLHTWFCQSYFLKTSIKCYCIYQYFMSINSFFNTVSVSRYSHPITVTRDPD
jgi:hypothetical protein